MNALTAVLLSLCAAWVLWRLCITMTRPVDTRPPSRLAKWLMAGIWACLCWGSAAQCQTVPAAAAHYRTELTRSAHLQWGLDAPLAVLAAQVHQESGWNPAAVSQVGALGMAQFMPSTASWWCKLNSITPDQCRPANPAWSMRALVGYDRWLFERVSAVDECQRLAKALSAYNGGLAWVQRDEALARSKGLAPARWFGQVEQVNAGRSPANWRENRDYPRRILLKLTPVYAHAGWGGEVCA